MPESVPLSFSFPFILLFGIAVCGCGEVASPTVSEAERAGDDSASEVASVEVSGQAEPVTTEPPAAGSTTEPENVPSEPGLAETAIASMVDHTAGGTADAEAPEPSEGTSLAKALESLEIPPPWLDTVETRYDTTKPWKEARQEIRRLLSLFTEATHQEALKLTWIYLKKNDMGDGHEYPMYTFLGGQPLWSIQAHEEFLNKPHENTPIHAHLTLASLYTQYREFEKAKATLDVAMAGLPGPPWRIMREADLAAAYGDLYAAWGKTAEAKTHYQRAVRLYPTAKPAYGQHLLPRRAAKVRAKLDLLTFQSLATAKLRDGTYRDTALGYAGDIKVMVVIKDGRIADIQLKHEEKIDQNACVLLPQWMIEQQSLHVDGISGATVTKDAIVNGVYRSLKQAGLE